MLDYLVLTLEIPFKLEEKIADWLLARGCLGLESRRIGEGMQLRAYFDTEKWRAEIAQPFASRFPQAALLSETAICLPAPGHGESSFRTLRLVGENFRLFSGPAFGGGEHPTTRLCAELMRRSELRDKAVLDVGTGTGILALLADRMGAGRIDAVEISPEARENARGNFDLNGTKSIDLFSDIAEVAGTYDVIVANLLTPTLFHLRESMFARLAPSGDLVVSGVTAEERERFFTGFTANLKLEEELREEEWLGLRFSSPL